VPLNALKSPMTLKTGADGKLELDHVGQLALLVGSGALAIHPEYDYEREGGTVRLCVPNLDARDALVMLLRHLLPLETGPTEAAFIAALRENNLAKLLGREDVQRALRSGIARLSGVPQHQFGGTARGGGVEARLSTALAAVVLGALPSAATPGLVYGFEEASCYRREASSGRGAPISPKAATNEAPRFEEGWGRVDHVFRLDGTAYLAEFKVWRGPELKGPKLRDQLREALVQCTSYQLDERHLRFSAHVFDPEGRQLVGTRSLELAEAQGLVALLEGSGPVDARLLECADEVSLERDAGPA
jgi:hypothetical protein